MIAGRERESRQRLEIRQRQEQLGALVGRLMGLGPLIAGSIYERKRRCGKPRCGCVQGRLHRDRVLAVRRAGQAVVRCLDPIEGAATEEAVVAWRLFRRQRRELQEACRGLIAAVDHLGRMRQAWPARAR